MPDKKHLILTASDANCGEFLVNHWLASLQDNVDLTDIDLAVIDYGLDAPHREALEAAGVTCYSSVMDAHVMCVRFRHAGEFLAQHDYDQVLMVDAADVIFQQDIKHLFEEDKDDFRVACEQIDTMVHEVWMPRGDFTQEQFDEMCRVLHGKPAINAGMILGPARRFKELWESIERVCSTYDNWISDQFSINYFLRTTGFVELDSKYNFVILSAKPGFYVREGVFHQKDGEVIPIVHNAGGTEAGRFVRKFGYGKDRNQLKWLRPMIARWAWAFVRLWKRGVSGAQA